MKYLQKIAVRKKLAKDLTVKELAINSAGRPLLLGEDLDKQAALRENGAVVNYKCFDSNLLECNGGHISL